MGGRQLFYALDEFSRTVMIDDLTEEARKKRYFCPKCYKDVIPKMGSEKIWHFAHKEECLLSKENKERILNQGLMNFFDKTIEVSQYKGVIDPDRFLCPICKEVKNKIIGIELKNKKLICQECFKKKNFEWSEIID